MTTKDLANLIFPNITMTIEDYEKMYPERDLPEGAKVTRYAPSPTGFMHIGNFMSSTINYCLAHNNGGVFYLRNEDTDSLREIEGAVEYIRHVLEHYNMSPDEYEYRDTNETKGNYGPYIQSERKDIYHAFIKHLIEEGKAYPCFLTQEEMDSIRESQTKDKKRIGIYGRYAKYRNLTPDEAAERINNGEKYTIRLKSSGDFNKKFKFEDLANGTMEFPENDIDVPIMKSSNLLPTYHFAHLVDDHLMRTTHVVRGQEWISSVPVHYELFKTFGFKLPKYVHTPFTIIVDSDDYLTDDAIEFYHQNLTDIIDIKELAGIAGLRGTDINSALNKVTYPINTYVIANNLERDKYNLQKDACEVFRTSILLSHPFFVWDNEKFSPEEIVWNQLALEGYSFRWYNKVTCIVRYQENGLTKDSFNLIKKNPMGYAMMYKQRILLSNNLKDKYYNACQMIAYTIIGKQYSHIYKDNSNILITLSAIPTGSLLAIRRKIQFRNTHL